ncbi:MAG: FG-GAP repeat domain-containing protein [Rubrobacteraceae bacterium]
MMIRFVLAACMVVILAGCSEERASEIMDGVRDRVDQATATGSPSEPASPEPAAEPDDETGGQFEQVAREVGFAPAATYPVEGASSVTAADFDGDGDTDLATANGFSDNISVLMNEGDGAFAAAVDYPVVETPSSITTADFDGDGDVDIASANAFSDDVSILMNEGDGVFAPAVYYPVDGESPQFITSSDLDGDGDGDLVTGNVNSNDITLLLNNGDGTFSEAGTRPVGENPGSIAASDLDGDGDTDLAVANGVSDSVSVLMNEGDGAFADDAAYQVDGSLDVTASDLDGDGDVDLVAAGGDTSTAPGSVMVLLNDGDGAFSAVETYQVEVDPVSVAASDLDGDDDMDLAIANFNSDNVSVLINEGDGTFAEGGVYPVEGEFPDSIIASDLDGDGDMDLATANFSSDNVSVLMNGEPSGGDSDPSDELNEASLDEQIGDYYRAAGAEEWAYTFDHLASETRTMFTEEEWFEKNQWLWDGNPLIYHINSINSDGSSAEVELRITGEDDASWTQTAYFVFEDGEWKNLFSDAEIDLFMPGTPFDEFVEAHGGGSDGFRFEDTWTGALTQTMEDGTMLDFELEVALMPISEMSADMSGEVVGETAQVGIECEGVWVLEEVGDDYIVVEERITDGADYCVESTTITLTPLNDGSLEYYFLDSYGSVGEGILTRQGGTVPVGDTGVCAGLSDCEVVDAADVDGDGVLDEVAIVGEPDEYSGETEWFTVRVLLADGTTLTRDSEVQFWGPPVYHGATDFGQAPGEELVVGAMSGAHTRFYRVLTYRDGELVELPYPDGGIGGGDPSMWPIDAAASINMGIECDASDSTVVLRSVSSVGPPSEDSTFEGEETRWALDGGEWRMVESSPLEYSDAASAFEISGWFCGDLPRAYD